MSQISLDKRQQKIIIPAIERSFEHCPIMIIRQFMKHPMCNNTNVSGTTTNALCPSTDGVPLRSDRRDGQGSLNRAALGDHAAGPEVYQVDCASLGEMYLGHTTRCGIAPEALSSPNTHRPHRPLAAPSRPGTDQSFIQYHAQKTWRPGLSRAAWASSPPTFSARRTAKQGRSKQHTTTNYCPI